MSAGPVFVDATGRRGRWIHRLFVALGVVVAAYIAVVFLALIGPPSLSRLAIPGLGPVLPGSGAPGLETTTGEHDTPSAVLSPRASATARPTPSPAGPAGGPTPAPTAPLTPSGLATGAPSPTATSPATTPATGPPVSPGPRSSQTPPGQASSKPKPSPRSTHARGTAQPSPSP